jgi:very-short-patch-repair endonuclease
MFVFNNSHLKNLRGSLRKNQTEAERKIWSLLKNRQILNCRFLRQYGVGDYILDFYCPQLKLAVEIDGGQHNFGRVQLNDIKRTEVVESYGIKVLRFWNNEVMENLEGVYLRIYELIKQRQNNPS